MKERTFTKKTRVTFRSNKGYIIGNRADNSPIFQADEEDSDLHNATSGGELFDGCSINHSRDLYWYISDTSYWKDLELLIEQKYEVGQKVLYCSVTRTILAIVPPLDKPYLLTDSDGESALDSGDKEIRELDTFFTVESNISPIPDSIDITVKVNGKTVELSEISEETLLNIRKNS